MGNPGHTVLELKEGFTSKRKGLRKTRDLCVMYKNSK